MLLHPDGESRPLPDKPDKASEPGSPQQDEAPRPNEHRNRARKPSNLKTTSFEGFLTRFVFRYDPYSGCLNDHYELGQVLGKGAYGEVVAARLRTKPRCFSQVKTWFSTGCCGGSCSGGNSVEAIVAAPDLDELIDSFRHKKNLEQAGSRGAQLIGTSFSQKLGKGFRSRTPEEEDLEPGVGGNAGEYVAASFGLRSPASVVPQSPPMSTPAPAMSIARPTVNVHPPGQSAVGKTRTSTRSSVRSSWTFAVKCMKKAALVEDEKERVASMEKRITAIEVLLKQADSSVAPALLASPTPSLLQVPGLPSFGGGGGPACAAGGKKKSSFLSLITSTSDGARRGSSRIFGSGRASGVGRASGIMQNLGLASQFPNRNSPRPSGLGLLPLLGVGGSSSSANTSGVNTEDPEKMTSALFSKLLLRTSLSDSQLALHPGNGSVNWTVHMKQDEQNIQKTKQQEAEATLLRTALEFELKDLKEQRQKALKSLSSIRSVSEAAVLKELKLLALLWRAHYTAT
eukprot:g7434.t1